MANGGGDSTPHERARLSYMNDIEVLVGKERASSEIVLADDSPQVVNQYISSAHSGSLRILEYTEGQIECDDLFELYILAKKLGDLDAANKAIDYLKFQLALGEHPGRSIVFRT
ncbi:hypothetical protein LTR78_006230 [Recurvomyces mirabilis]|uniref:Uncharacterized protein n=1 Tax=Recurvomyces mirabilis TaxID=574656 RepID=A0AAE0WLP2_9PEZI|nr:hypothetical protein LTR78_006230 [Recurvomyces mirabilis]KAK5152071.1 hypothetical protein LTS14_008846 [Recurvomyces mirabilis]